MLRIANKNASEYTTKRIPFRANNLFAELHGNTYIVFSYGYHWPLYVYKSGQWYENKDGYSTTTGKQKSQARPKTVLMISLSCDDMRKFY